MGHGRAGEPRLSASPPGRTRERIHDADLAQGFDDVELPWALGAKYPNAARRWGWQYAFPAASHSADQRTGVIRRHHLLECSVQRAVKGAASRARIAKSVSPHILRHAFATLLPQPGHDIWTVQELLGHGSVETTMILTHTLNRGGRGVTIPLGAIQIMRRPHQALR